MSRLVKMLGPDCTDPKTSTRGNSEKLGFTLAGLDSDQDLQRSYSRRVPPALDSIPTCSVKSVKKSVSGKTYYTVTAEDFTGSDTLYGCTGAGGMLTAKVYGGGSVQPNPHRSKSITVNVRNN